ncbi:MAG: hypothetical protein K2H46_02550 [Muribaculaceae bacterium]|nr:hypothetical protein [Muribaculaceae bacterium]
MTEKEFTQALEKEKEEYLKFCGVPKEAFLRTPIDWRKHKPKSSEKVIEGWVLRDDNNRVGIYLNKPTCDEDGYWDLTGESYELSRKLFPDITPEDEPKKYRITITPME